MACEMKQNIIVSCEAKKHQDFSSHVAHRACAWQKYWHAAHTSWEIRPDQAMIGLLLGNSLDWAGRMSHFVGNHPAIKQTFIFNLGSRRPTLRKVAPTAIVLPALCFGPPGSRTEIGSWNKSHSHRYQTMSNTYDMLSAFQPTAAKTARNPQVRMKSWLPL